MAALARRDLVIPDSRRYIRPHQDSEGRPTPATATLAADTAATSATAFAAIAAATGIATED